MYFYIKGTVVEQYGSYIVLDKDNIGYLINVANPYSFELNKEYKVFIYQQIREDLQLAREAASELLQFIGPDRIEKIENEKSTAHPDEVLLMADKYKRPELCNYYCANQCPIGQQYVPSIKIKELSQIVIEMLASLNVLSKQKDRLIEISVDGRINDDEMEDFIFIQQELEKISIAVETLQLWLERMLADGKIDIEKYNEVKNKRVKTAK